MRVNFFEGARRIAYLIAGIWSVAIIYIFWDSEPTVNLGYVVAAPGLPPIRTDEIDCGSDDASETDYTKTKSGTSVRLQFCFRAQEFESGERLIVHKSDDKKKLWWGGRRYSSEVSSYIAQFVSRFQLPRADSDWADSQKWPARLRQLWESSRIIFGGLFGLWVFASLTGWIVRGFAGIPMGQDVKLAEKKEEQTD